MKTTAALLALFTLTFTAHAGAAPINPAQAPGYYRYKVGDFEITAITDGATTSPLAGLTMSVRACDDASRYSPLTKLRSARGEVSVTDAPCRRRADGPRRAGP